MKQLTELREISAIYGRYLRWYGLLVAACIVLNWHAPGWNAPSTLVQWLGVMALNEIFGRFPAKAEGHMPFVIVGGVVSLALLAGLLRVGGASSWIAWFGCATCAIGIATRTVVVPGYSFPLLLAFNAVYLAFYFFFSAAITPEVVTRGLARMGFILLVTGFVITVMRRLLERAYRLEDEKERFAQLSENIEEVFWLTDLTKYDMVYISPGYERIWGRSRRSLYEQPMSFLDAIHPDDRAKVVAALPEQATGGYDIEYRVVRPDGSIRWIRDRAFPVRDAGGRVYRMAGIAQDITSLKDSAARLDQQRLALANASKLSSLGEMAAGIAHEINNPLTIIQGNAQLLVRMAERAALTRGDLEGVSQTIALTTARIAKIIKGLHAFAKEGGSEGLETAQLKSVITDTLGFCEAKFRHHDIVLEIEPFADDLLVRCRPVQISQVLLNLLNNAFDAVVARPVRRVRI
ncbi:MAG: PAS domain-containing protein, partial [Deltaproteobacteria bacterium]|nr:PAS domain-containing protein [Deltaproteobacteria bacterium]